MLTLRHKHCLRVFFFGLACLLAWPQSAKAQDAAIQAGQSAYKQKQWDQALAQFRRALKQLRGQPAFKKAPVYLMIGLSLYHKGNKGLAWKAFEQGLYQNTNTPLPFQESAEVKGFFERVRTRVVSRGGHSIRFKAPATKAPSRPSGGGGGGIFASPFPWALFALAAGCAGGGVVLFLNASANETELKTFKTAAADDGKDPQATEDATKNIKNSIDLQNTVSLSLFIAGGVALAGGVVLLILSLNSKKPSKRSRAPAPSSTPRFALLSIQ